MGAAAKKAGKLAIMAANGAVNLCVLLLTLALIAFAGYALWDSDQLYNAADPARYQIYKPTAQDEGESFGQLRAINPDVFAWLTIFGTHVDYPVTQGEDNWKYVNTDAKGEYNMAGAIFLDVENAADFTDFNSIFYGHHMDKDTMFGGLDKFAEEEYFAQRPHGNLYFNGQEHGLEFFAFLHTDAYDGGVFSPAVQGEAQQEYLDNLLANAIHTRDIGVSVQDNILLLTTCSSSSTNGRDILAARITDAPFSDTFITEEINITGSGADEQAGLWGRTSTWVWILVPALLALGLLVLLVVRQIRKKRGAARENQDAREE